MKNLIDLVQNEFIRLGVDASIDSPYSGLMCNEANVNVDGGFEPVSVCDDYSTTIYNGELLLDILRKRQTASLNPDSEINIWQLIDKAEI